MVGDRARSSGTTSASRARQFRSTRRAGACTAEVIGVRARCDVGAVRRSRRADLRRRRMKAVEHGCRAWRRGANRSSGKRVPARFWRAFAVVRIEPQVRGGAPNGPGIVKSRLQWPARDVLRPVIFAKRWGFAVKPRTLISDAPRVFEPPSCFRARRGSFRAVAFKRCRLVWLLPGCGFAVLAGMR
jgi:hypothetical protein